MKKIPLYIITTAIALSGSAGFAFAQETESPVTTSSTATTRTKPPILQKIKELKGSTTTPQKQPLKENLGKKIEKAGERIEKREEKIGEKMENRLEKNASSTPRKPGEMGDERGNREFGQKMKMFNHIKNMLIKINSTIIRLEKLTTNLNSRIAKIKALGENTSVAEENSKIATDSIAIAKNDVTSVRSILINASTTGSIDTNASSTIRTTMKNAEDQIKTAQKALETAVKSLKELKIEENKKVETTNQ